MKYVKQYLRDHGLAGDFKKLEPCDKIPDTELSGFFIEYPSGGGYYISDASYSKWLESKLDSELTPGGLTESHVLDIIEFWKDYREGFYGLVTLKEAIKKYEDSIRTTS